jgi:hypothetical protein
LIFHHCSAKSSAIKILNGKYHKIRDLEKEFRPRQDHQTGMNSGFFCAIPYKSCTVVGFSKSKKSSQSAESAEQEPKSSTFVL